MTYYNWQKLKTKLKKTTDSLGCGIDNGIIDLVVSLNYLNINVDSSCEGHLDHGCPNPWVDIESLEDVSQLTDEAYQIRQPADNESSNLSEEKRAQLWQQSRRILDKAAQPNLIERLKLSNLLSEFYRSHHAQFDEQLHIEDYDFYCSRLESNGASLQEIRTDQEKKEKLIAYQKEMQAFADFLKEKCLNQEK